MGRGVLYVGCMWNSLVNRRDRDILRIGTITHGYIIKDVTHVMSALFLGVIPEEARACCLWLGASLRTQISALKYTRPFHGHTQECGSLGATVFPGWHFRKAFPITKSRQWKQTQWYMGNTKKGPQIFLKRGRRHQQADTLTQHIEQLLCRLSVGQVFGCCSNAVHWGLLGLF